MKQIFKRIKELFTFRGIVSHTDALKEPCKAVFNSLESVKKEIDNRKNSDLLIDNKQELTAKLDELKKEKFDIKEKQKLLYTIKTDPEYVDNNFKYESPVQKVAENYVSKSEIVLKEGKKKEIELFKKSDNEPKKKRRYNKKKH